MDLNAFYKVTYGLYIVSSIHEGKAAGCIVNTLTQVTAEPVKLAVTLSKQSFTAKTMEKSGVFASVPLTQSAGLDTVKPFGFQTSAEIDKFSQIPAALDRNGVPYPTEHAGAYFSCRIIDQLDLGTHTLFVGEAEEAEILSDEDLMTYEYYRIVKRGGTPPSAPSYKRPSKKAK